MFIFVFLTVLPTPGGGGAKILSIGWLGENYDNLLSKNANIRGKGGKTGKQGKFSPNLGKNIIFEKGVRQKYPILGKYTPLCRLAGLTDPPVMSAS